MNDYRNIDSKELFGDDYCSEIRKRLDVSDSLLWDMFISADLNTGCVKFWMADIWEYAGKNKMFRIKYADEIKETALEFLCGVMCGICKSRQNSLGYVDYVDRDFSAEKSEYMKSANLKIVKLTDVIDKWRY